MQKISEAEMEIMKVLWNNPNPLTSKEIMELISQQKWKPTTVLTLLSRLMEKGFLEAEKRGRAYFYNYTLSEREYKKSCGKAFLQEFYEGSAKNFFTALCNDGALSQKDLEELRGLLEEKGE